MGTLRTDGEYGRTEWAATVGSAISTACAGNGRRVGLASDQAKRAGFASRATDILGIVVSISRAQAQPGDVAIVSAACSDPIQKSEPHAVSAGRWSLMREGDVSEQAAKVYTIAEIQEIYRRGDWWVAHRVAMKALEHAELAHQQDLTFFGAERTPEGDLRINMPKYHAAHRCDTHRETPWRTQDLDECVPCLRTRLAEAEEQRDTLVRGMGRMATDNIAYRGALGHPIPGEHDGRLSDGTTPHCGLCEAKDLLLTAAEQRGRAQRDQMLDWLADVMDAIPDEHPTYIALTAVRERLWALTPGALSVPPPGDTQAREGP